MSIFKAYDIRGLYPSELNKEITYKIGRAFVSYFKPKEVVIGYDVRASSSELFEALSKGITDQGADVVDIGLASTPLLYFASKEAEASIMITASHLPKQYNGLKFCQKQGSPVREEEIKKIEEIIIREQFSSQEIKVGQIKKIDQSQLMTDFINYNLAFLKGDKKLKIVLDTGNGMSGYTLPKIIEKIDSINLIELYTEIDFSFPNHESNPINFETLKDLQKRVIVEGADFGVATDADGDRVVFIDELGQIISPDLIIALIAKYFLRQPVGDRQKKIMYDVRCSKIIKEIVEQNNGKAIISKVGHSFIKKKMRDEDIFFAGELSGHFYYKENNYAESPFITMAMIINILSEHSQSLSQIIAPFQKYYSPGEINFKVEDKVKKTTKIEKIFKDKSQKIEKLDGLSVYFKDWWFNIRQSNTENLLRLNLEANTKELAQKKLEKLSNIIQKADVL